MVIAHQCQSNHRMVLTIKEYSVHQLKHKPHMSLFSTSLHKLCQSEVWKYIETSWKSKGEEGERKVDRISMIILTHTSRIDLTPGFCSWNSLRKSSLEKSKTITSSETKTCKDYVWARENLRNKLYMRLLHLASVEHVTWSFFVYEFFSLISTQTKRHLHIKKVRCQNLLPFINDSINNPRRYGDWERLGKMTDFFLKI